MRVAIGIGICAALCVGGCSVLFNGNDLHGDKGDGGGGTGGTGGSGGTGGTGGTGGSGGTGGAGGGGSLTVSFSATTPAAVGKNPYSVAVGDFDGDGEMDAVTANEGASNVTFLFGDGAGNFTPITIPMPAADGCAPYAIAAGRFDADAIDDVIVTCTDLGMNNHVYILAGATGRMYTPVGIAALASASSMVTKPEGVGVGDFDHDGNLDVVTANGGNTSAWIAFGKGDGTFKATATKLTIGNHPYGVTVGDFNGDGKDDFAIGDYAVANVYAFLQPTSGGTFTAATYNSVNAPGGLAAGDLDADGNADLVTSDQTGDAVAVFLADASGTFPGAVPPSQPPEYPAHPSPADVALGDFNGDGKLDIVCANADADAQGNPGGSIDVLLGNGDGTFASAMSLGMSRTPIGVRVADFNGDGLADFIVVNNDDKNPTATLYLNTSH